MRSRLPAPSFRALLVASGAIPVALGAAPALGQSQGVLGRDDAVFARELYRRGWADLAERLCDTIEKGGKVSPDAAVGVKALHLDLRLDLAKNEADPIKRKDLIKTVLQEKEDLIHQYPASKEAEEASNSLPDVYRTLGEAITVAIQKEANVGVVAQLQKEGEQFYSQAEQKLKTRIEEMADDHATPEKERVYVSLLYNLPRTLYYHSLLYPAGEWKKKDLLEKAILGFQQFGLDWQDTLLNYEGLVLTGLAEKELGRNEDALGDFDAAIALCERFDKDKDVYLLNAEAADTVSGAVLQKVLFRTELKDYAGAVAAARKFFTTVPDPYQTRLGLAILAAQADAQLAAGDAKAANEAAQKLVELDERGRWGAKGREIQAKLLGGAGGGQIDAANTLKIAGSLAGRDPERALQVCHQAIAAARGTDKEASVGVEGYLLIGSIFLQREPPWYFEAALAFDTAAERWPKAEKAPEAVYQSMLTYLHLNTEDKRPWFKKRADDRLKSLSTLYPNHLRAAYAQLADGTQLEAEGKFQEAAELYQRIQPGSAVYLEAQYRAGNAYFRLARKLCLEKKEGEAAQWVKQAETLLKKAQHDLEAAVKGTMDLETQSRYENTGFQARVALAQMYLLDCVNRPTEVLKVLEGVDDRYANDAEKLAAAWGFRISALEKQGKLDEAVALLDSLIKKDPESRAIGGAAGQVARALDKRADDLFKQGKARESDDQLKRAAVYYAMSGRGLAKSGTARASDIDVIANRLFALGLHFNEVPAEGLDSFVGWQASKMREPNLWKAAEELYSAALQLAPSYQNMIKLGRSLGFQGRFADATAVYGRLFDSEPIIDVNAKPPKSPFNGQLLRQKNELYLAYLEWGVAAEEAAPKEQDQTEMFVRAGTIFDNLVRIPEPTAKIFWHAKYHQIRNQMAQGKYPEAGRLMRDIERMNPELGAPAGLQNEFKTLKNDLSKKVFDGSTNGTKQGIEKK
jgi:tetratricopeptide (TPR) repeat protein